MKTITYRWIDKQGWGEGPWQEEPDKVQWQTQAGLPALVVRTDWMGHWCGYVGVPEGHPAYRQGYDDVFAEVHGGLTFADACGHDPAQHGICHVPDEGEPDNLWWLGFDCAHWQDLSPAFRVRMDELDRKYGHPPDRDPKHYWTLAEVQAECEQLAQQLAGGDSAD